MSLIPAYHISKRSRGCGVVEDYVNEILSVINDDIEQALEQEKHFAVTEVQTDFQICEMRQDRAQKFVYYHVLRALRKAGYYPKIRFDGVRSQSQRVFIYVKWFSKQDCEYEEYMNKYIIAHDISKKITTSNETQPGKPIRRRRRK